MPTNFGTAKSGLRDYLTAQPGLGPDDEVTVRSATITPEEFTATLVVLGDITATQAQAGLKTRATVPTMQGWVIVTRTQHGLVETVIDAARDRAEAVFALVEQALDADASAGGAAGRPGRFVIVAAGLEETPVSWSGADARRATIPFSLSWTVHT
jgi:hypothetical protein